MAQTNSINLPSRGWLIAGGILSIFAGLFAITYPLVASIAVTQMIGALALVTGLFELIPGIFSREVTHRWLTILSAAIRVIAGIYLLMFPVVATAFLTLFLGVVFLVEGIFSIIASFKLKPRSGWIWVLINGVTALLLGALIYFKWPSDSIYIVGLLFGINCLFVGFALLALSPASLAAKEGETPTTP